ncbi:type II secretion system protein GspG [Planctomycetota bacterium]
MPRHPALYAALCLIVGAVGWFVISGVKHFMDDLEVSRLADQLSTEESLDRQAELACQVLSRQPTEPRSTKLLLRASLGLGSEKRLSGLAPLFADNRVALPARAEAEGLWLLEARYRLHQGEFRRATEIFSAFEGEGALSILDRRRLLRCRIGLGELEEAFRLSLVLSEEASAVRWVVLPALAKADHPFVRPAAAEAALAICAGRAGSRAATRLTEALAETHPELACTLLSTVLLSVAEGAPLAKLRVALAQSLADRLASKLREGRARGREITRDRLQRVAPCSDPWGHPFVLQLEPLAVVSHGADGKPAGKGTEADVIVPLDAETVPGR